MQDSIRRVHKLKLRSHDENAIGGDINALQDAFRIASLPGIPPQGLLLIRKLDLGAFQTRSSSLALSQLIDDRVRTLAPTALCVDQGEQAEHDLVWFSDSLSAAICLVELIATEQAPRAWYWRLVFPSWRIGMNLQQTIEAIVADQRGEPAAHRLMARVFERQVEGGSIDRIVNAVTPQLAQSLLREAGAFSGPTDSSPGFEANAVETWRCQLRPEWSPVIIRALETWSGNDVRSLWLGYCAFTTQNPALTADAKLLGKIKTVMTTLVSAPNSGPNSGPNPAPIADEQQEPSYPSFSQNESGVVDPAGQREQTGLAESRSGASNSPATNARPDSSPISAEDDLPRSDSVPRTRPIAKPQVATSTSSATGTHADPAPDKFKIIAAEIETSDPRSSELEHDVIDRDDAAIAFGGLIECRHSGLMFVVSLLELLGINPLLENNPALALVNLPARVVIDIAQRLQISTGHPLLRALPILPTADIAIEELDSPDIWRHLLASPATAITRLHRFDTCLSGSRCYLTDSSRNLLLHVGSSELPQWSDDYPITRHRGEFPLPQPEDLSRTLQLLMGRYLRRYAGMSLRQLANRAGRIASTRTHLDILFETKQMDIGIRKSGLDINPGWVMWLARVVQFHYDDGDAADV